MENRYAQIVAELVQQPLPGRGSALEQYIVQNSYLPGPAGNLTLIYAVADRLALALAEGNAAVWHLLEAWAAITADEAPVNDPRELLPAAAAVANGESGARADGYWTGALARLHSQASDPRWRTRECVAMGLQRMARVDFDEVCRPLSGWVIEGDWLVLRAAVAALAEPCLLVRPEQAAKALALHDAVIERLLAAPASARKTEGYQALRKGLGYSISVVAVALPAPSFERIRVWIGLAKTDRDLRWVLVQNLKKNRLVKGHAEEARTLLEQLG